MMIDHLSEFLVRFKPLHLTEACAEQISGVEPHLLNVRVFLNGKDRALPNYVTSSDFSAASNSTMPQSLTSNLDKASKVGRDSNRLISYSAGNLYAQFAQKVYGFIRKGPSKWVGKGFPTFLPVTSETTSIFRVISSRCSPSASPANAL